MKPRFVIGIFPSIIFVFFIDSSVGLGLDYVVSKDTKCNFNESEHLSAISAIECASKCGKRNGCKRVNFKRPDCQILISDSAPDLEDNMIEAHGWRCIRKFDL